MALQSSMSFLKLTLAGPVSSGCAKFISMLQRRTTTFLAGLVIFGAFLVYWYARVSMRKSGYSFAMSAATALTKRSSRPEGLPSSSSIALHLAHWQLPRQSFCEMEIMPAAGFWRIFSNATFTNSLRISSLVRQSW